MFEFSNIIILAKKLELIGLNILSFGWIALASFTDNITLLGALVGILVGISILGLNVFKMITESRKWKNKAEKENGKQNRNKA